VLLVVAVRTVVVKVGDAVAGVPGGCGGYGGGCEQQAGEGVTRADRVGGPGGAVLRCPGRLYEVRHQSPRAWQALHVQAVTVPAGCPATPNQLPQLSHCMPPLAVAGAGAAEEGGQLLGSHCHLPHRGQESSAITGRCRVSTGCRL
jgi:hypothetical protein